MSSNVIPLRREVAEDTLSSNVVLAGLAQKGQIQEVKSLNILPEDDGHYRVNLNVKLIGSPRFQWIREYVKTLDTAIDLALSSMESHRMNNPDDGEFVDSWEDNVRLYREIADEPMSLFRPGR